MSPKIKFGIAGIIIVLVIVLSFNFNSETNIFNNDNSSANVLRIGYFQT